MDRNMEERERIEADGQEHGGEGEERLMDRNSS